MTVSLARLCAVVFGTAIALVAPASAFAADVVSAPEQLTSGDRYDRNPSVVVDGDEVWVFFARSRTDCDRLEDPPTCDPDQLPTNLPVPGVAYDLMALHSTDGGATYSAPEVVATNPTPVVFRGRTIAATRTDNGVIHVFWADGGSGGPVLHFRKAPTETTFDNAGPVGPLEEHFNVEAIARGDEILVYSDPAVGAEPINVRTVSGEATGVPTEGTPGDIGGTEEMSIPKVMRDASGTYRMALSKGDGSVQRLRSLNGESWEAPVETIPAAPPITHWDPSFAQHADGRFFLFDAPDLEGGAGSQKIDFRTSSNFSTWSASTEVTTGLEGTSNKYWDYWPEGALIDGVLTLFYTSERPATGQTDAGTGHIFASTIELDTDGDGILDDADCDPDDETKPASGGTDANCDGTVDPAPILDTDGDGYVDGSDCAPDDPTKPATDSDCDGTPNPTPLSDRDGDGILDGSDCNPDDAAKPHEDGPDKDCDGNVDPAPAQQQQQTPQQDSGGGGGTGTTALIISLCGAGTPAADLIVCGAERNVISGLAGDDRLFGGDGDDRINGGNGDDTIGGGGGADRLNGQNGDDSIDGGTGNDRISGGSGEDSMVGGAGNDRLTGGRGTDVVRAGSGKDVINVRDRRGGDVVSCGSGRDTVVYDRGDIVSRDCERRLRRR